MRKNHEQCQNRDHSEAGQPCGQDPVEVQQQCGYRWLRFIPELESGYQSSRAQMMRERARPVAVSALLLFLLYSILDGWFFPLSLSSQTVAVRLLVTCPVIAAVLVLSYRLHSDRWFVRYYILSYLWGGLSLLLIIWLSRRQNIAMPYDGVLLMLMFGFFLMGLPFRSVTLTSTVIVILYVCLEIAVSTPLRTLLFNCFFLLTAYLIGVVGAWLQEYQLRTHFLDRTRLARSQAVAENESERKTQVLAAAGHDLRQPLNVINLLLENLQADQPSHERDETLQQLRGTTRHFGDLLSSLLDLSRLREGLVRPSIACVSVADVATELIGNFTADAQARGVQLTYSDVDSAAVSADPVLLHRILQNLIANALTHSGASDLGIEVACQFDQIRIWVKDNGRGIQGEYSGHLFQAFFRGPAGQIEQGPGLERGLGLGLAIVRQLAELMRGRCGFEPASPGSHFWIELPRAQQASIPRQEASTTGMNRGGYRVLLVEDDASARQELEALIANWGIAVQSYASAELALGCSWIAGRPVREDLLILLTDLHLPGLDGYALFEKLRARRPNLACVVMTADNDQAPRYDAIERLCVMAKPLAPGRLRAVLQRFVRTGKTI